MSEWVESRLDKLADIVSGGTPSRDVAEYWGGGIPWVTPTDITACATNYLLTTSDTLTRLGMLNSSAKMLPTGSILFTSRASVGLAKLAAMPVCTNQGFKSLVPRDGVDGGFLFYQVERLRGQFQRYAAGSTFPEINKGDTGRICIPHPIDKDEQRRIAAVIEAVDVAIQSTSELIAKYQQIKAGLMHDLFTRGLMPDGLLRPPREQTPDLYRETEVGWLPVDWHTEPLGRNAKIVSGVTLGTKTAPANAISVPYLRVANVQDGYLDLQEIKTIEVSPQTAEQLRLLPGDVLMNEGGDFDKLGRGAVWSGEVDNCIHQNHVFRVRCDKAKLQPEFLAFFTEAHFGKRYFRVNSKQSTNLASINSTQLHAYPVPLPPPREQERIVERINKAVWAISAFEVEVGKLRKQKWGLMQDLLTGKVAVEHLVSEAVDA